MNFGEISKAEHVSTFPPKMILFHVLFHYDVFEGTDAISILVLNIQVNYVDMNLTIFKLCGIKNARSLKTFLSNFIAELNGVIHTCFPYIMNI